MEPDKAKILVVDDSPDKLLSIEAILEELGQTIVCVDSGAKALRKLLAEDFAVILLDVNMPGMDGFETATLIRQHPRSEHTPLIFLTAFPDETHAWRGYSLGAVDYILTPVVPEVLRTKVSVFIELYRLTQQERRRAEERISLAEEHAARVAAERANRTKNEFLANVSHELRTPMNAIIGMTDLALQEELSPLVREYLNTAQSSAHTLLELLNEILDFSKMEAGKFVLAENPFKLHELIDDIRRGFEFRASEKNLTFSVQIDTRVPETLIGDVLRLRQVLVNLVSNALKFTDSGGVSIRVDTQSATARQAHLQFSVIDSGIGISDEDQMRIFSPFTQVDASSTRRHTGTGLGLAIASEIVHAMGGQLEVQSEMGRGSNFCFRIPLSISTAPVPTSGQRPRAPQSVDQSKLFSSPAPVALRVLLAEDVPANQKLVLRALEKRGHSVAIAADGQEAVERTAQGKYDVILMDVQMPHLDGFQATAAIRAMPQQPRIPIIALTAHAMPGDIDRCLRAGMDGYLAKPLDLVKLIEVVESYTPQTTASSE